MTDSYDSTYWAALLREERDANRILKAGNDRLKAENARLAEENADLRRQVWDQIRDETEAIGTFPAMPRSKLGVTL